MARCEGARRGDVRAREEASPGLKIPAIWTSCRKLPPLPHSSPVQRRPCRAHFSASTPECLSDLDCLAGGIAFDRQAPPALPPRQVRTDGTVEGAGPARKDDVTWMPWFLDCQEPCPYRQTSHLGRWKTRESRSQVTLRDTRSWWDRDQVTKLSCIMGRPQLSSHLGTW